jgi:hypothetical protein
MTDEASRRDEDRDPAPLQHTPAERVTEEEGHRVASPEEAGTASYEQDPAADPPEGPLRDLKGG